MLSSIYLPKLTICKLLMCKNMRHQPKSQNIQSLLPPVNDIYCNKYSDIHRHSVKLLFTVRHVMGDGETERDSGTVFDFKVCVGDQLHLRD